MVYIGPSAGEAPRSSLRNSFSISAGDSEPSILFIYQVIMRKKSRCISLISRAKSRARELATSKTPRPACSWLRVRLPWNPSRSRRSFNSALNGLSLVEQSRRSLLNGWSKPCQTLIRLMESPLSSKREYRKLDVSMRRGGAGNSDSVLSGSLASPMPPGGGEPKERGNEAHETESRSTL